MLAVQDVIGYITSLALSFFSVKWVYQGPIHKYVKYLAQALGPDRPSPSATFISPVSSAWLLYLELLLFHSSKALSSISGFS